MKPNKDNSQNIKDTLTDIDLLFSSGYLAPRSEEDLQRFDRIYSGCTFETEKHRVDANAIFDKVMHNKRNNHVGTKVDKVFPSSYSYLVASSIEDDGKMLCAEDMMDFIKKEDND